MNHLGTILTVSLTLYGLGMRLFLISENRRPQATLAWMLALILAPGIGLLIYILFGRDWKAFSKQSRLLRQDLEASARPVLSPLLSRQDAEIARLEGESASHRKLMRLVRRNSQSALTTRNRVEIQQDAAVFYARLMEDMEAARHSIHLQYFIWRADTFTARVKEILTTKARAGVEVRLLYDPLGSHANLSRAYIREMHAAGVRMVSTSPLYRLHTISYRNHRKITVIDGTIGYTGGMNIGQEHLDGGEGFDSWRDTQVRIVGEATALLQQVELLDRLLVEAREAIRTHPEREQAVLQDTMQRHGFGEATARAATRDLSRDPERALTVYSRAVLGMNPEELGSPWASALSSLATFAAGAMVPLVPWFITTGVSATVGSLALAGGAALAIGGLLGQLTGGRWRRAALRQLVVVALASGITLLVGGPFGTTVY